MSDVFFIPFDPASGTPGLSQAAVRLLQTLLEQSGDELPADVPLKVHFGEKGNRTYLKPEVYDGIIDFIRAQGRTCHFVETSVLYGGERFSREKHLALAKKHGFTRIPAVIADGAHGEESVSVPVHLKHFQSASIAKALAEADRVVVLSHFKGHGLAGFGGAIKQLSMGFAAKGGKMAMHLNVKPRIRNWKCKRCKLCLTRCNEGAITIGERSFIDHGKCIGCGACFSICPHHAVSILSFAGLKHALFGGRLFREKLVEYAYASHHGKHHLYITFAVNVTRGCDCEPRPMTTCVHDIGVFASLDPVAIDAACWDAAAKAGKRFKGAEQLAYAEKIGLGTRSYNLIQLD